MLLNALRISMRVGRWRGKSLTHAQMHTLSLSLSLTHTHREGNTLFLLCSSAAKRNSTVHSFEETAHRHTPPLFVTHTSVSLRVYHDDPCHKGEALNKTRVIGGGEDAKLTKQLKQRP